MATPNVKLFKVTVDDGRVFFVRTVTRAMTTLIMKTKFPSVWGHSMAVGVMRTEPKGLREMEGIPNVFCL